MSEESKEKQERAPSARSPDDAPWCVFDASEAGRPSCDFCHRRPNEKVLLAVGRETAICGGCADLAADLLRGERAAPAAPSSPADLSARETDVDALNRACVEGQAREAELLTALRAAREWIAETAFVLCIPDSGIVGRIDALLTSAASAAEPPPKSPAAAALPEEK